MSWVLPNGWSVNNGALVGVANVTTIAYRDVALPANVTVVTGGSLTMTSGTAPNIAVVARQTNGGDYHRLQPDGFEPLLLRAGGSDRDPERRGWIDHG